MSGEDCSFASMEYSRDGYEKQLPRVSKPDMFIIVALWMEIEGPPEEESSGGHPVREETGDRPLKPTKKYHKTGAVVVLPNDRALSVDCSQGGLHAAVSALNKFGQERTKGCQVYLSRRPCSHCAKLLVQCEVAKVYYLPIKPELNDAEDVRRVDRLFKASSTGLSVYIPKVSRNVIQGLERRASPYLSHPRNQQDQRKTLEFKEERLIKEYWSPEWIDQASTVLEWPAFKDAKMKKQTKEDMENVLEWIAKATKGDVPDYVKFEEIDPHTDPLKGKKTKLATGEKTTQQKSNKESVPSEPIASDFAWQKHALHMSRMAQMLSQRSDDPTGPVGCVLMVHGEVAAIGWNGFPAKALYGEFPRASDNDDAREKKEPYVIHAEQNAMLTRNKRNMNHKSSVLFSNKIPCGECVPMLIQAGVQNVVVPHESRRDVQQNEAFTDAIKNKTFKGFWPVRFE